MDTTRSEAALASELRTVLAKLKRRLRQQADGGDLTPTQSSALVRLERDGPSTVSALARAEGVRSQSMGAVVAPLQAAGLVTGAPDPADGRQILLSVTPAFREWLASTRSARQDWLMRVIERELSPDEQELLARSVVLLRRIADS